MCTPVSCLQCFLELGGQEEGKGEAQRGKYEEETPGGSEVDSLEFLFVFPSTLNKILNSPSLNEINIAALLAEAGQEHLGRAHAQALFKNTHKQL